MSAEAVEPVELVLLRTMVLMEGQLVLEVQVPEVPVLVELVELVQDMLAVQLEDILVVQPEDMLAVRLEDMLVVQPEDMPAVQLEDMLAVQLVASVVMHEDMVWFY